DREGDRESHGRAHRGGHLDRRAQDVRLGAVGTQVTEATPQGASDGAGEMDCGAARAGRGGLMADKYDNNRTGVLFPNDQKRDGERDPNLRGSCEIDGVEFWVDAWTKIGKEGSKVAGKKFLTLRFRPKEQQPDRGAAPIDDDEIPF